MPGFIRLDVDHDIPDGIGCDAAGTVRYIDKDLFEAILNGDVDTGLKPEQVIDCLVVHIEAERTLSEQSPDMPWHDISMKAHEAEANKVLEFGGDVNAYDAALAPMFISCKRKAPKSAPSDLMDLESTHGGQRPESASGSARAGGPSVGQQSGGRVDGAEQPDEHAAAEDVQPGRA